MGPFDQQLMDAAVDGDLVSLRELIGKGANPNATDATGFSALIYATDRPGDAACAEVLLNAGADIQATMPVTRQTPLHLALTHQNGPLVSLLLLRGAKMQVHDLDGHSPLTYTLVEHLKGRSLWLPELLVAAGAEVDFRQRNGPTPLLIACAGSLDAVHMLLSSGADPNLTYQKDGTSVDAVDVVTANGRSDILKLLHEYGARENR